MPPFWMIGGAAGGVGILLAGSWSQTVGIPGMGWAALISAIVAALLIIVTARDFGKEHERQQAPNDSVPAAN
jgi:hypothetical protein